MTSEVIPCRLAAGNYRLHEDLSIVFNERHDVRVTLDINDQDPLTRVPLLVGVFQNIQDVTPFNVKHNFLKRDASGLLEQTVLFGTPGEVLHSTNVVQCVLFVNTYLTLSISGGAKRRPLHVVVGHLLLVVAKLLLTGDAAATKSTYPARLLPTCPRE